MKISYTTPRRPKPLTKYAVARSTQAVRNLETLWAVAGSVISRSHESIERYEPLWEMKELVENIALVVSKTYAERGDAYKLTDDTALMQIRDLLLQHDPTIISNSKLRKAHRFNKRLKWLRRE